MNNIDFYQTSKTYTADSGAVQVHRGFLTEWETKLAPRVTAAVKQLLQKHPGSKVYVTGHSKGGALATLAALHLKTVLPSGQFVGAYTFGSPRAGGSSFASLFQESVQQSWRFVHSAGGSAAGGYAGSSCTAPTAAALSWC
jgi:predicted lipase